MAGERCRRSRRRGQRRRCGSCWTATGEVAGLALGDIGWRAGQITARGKGNRAERLPADAGEAIAAYLRDGRPEPFEGARRVFLRARAPHRGLTSGGVTQAVFSAGQQAGIGPVYAHWPRHSAATGMPRVGVPLPGRRCGTAGCCPRRSTPRPTPRRCGRALEDYLQVRGSLGYKLARPEKLLGQFIGYLEGAGAATEHALAWAVLAGGDASWHAYPLSAVRGFAAWLRTIDEDAQVRPRR